MISPVGWNFIPLTGVILCNRTGSETGGSLKSCAIHMQNYRIVRPATISLTGLHQRVRSNIWLPRFTIFTRVMRAPGFTPSGLTKVPGNRCTLLSVDTPVGFFFTASLPDGRLLALHRIVPVAGGAVADSAHGHAGRSDLSSDHPEHLRYHGFPALSGHAIYGLMLLASTWLLCWDYDKLKDILATNKS